jgi:hypothetical protein
MLLDQGTNLWLPLPLAVGLLLGLFLLVLWADAGWALPAPTRRTQAVRQTTVRSRLPVRRFARATRSVPAARRRRAS